jgi:hypothetical protein
MRILGPIVLPSPAFMAAFHPESAGRALARGFGYSKPTMARVWMPAIDRLAPHLGQDGWETPSRVKDALARDKVALSSLGRKPRSAPRDSSCG